MEPVVIFRDARLAYGSRVALEVADLRIPGAAVTALIGPNGSGKSTLLSAIAGLVTPVTGEVAVGGRPPGHGEERVAYVLQDTAANQLLPMTVREVVMLGRYGRLGFFGIPRRPDREAVESAMERMHVADLATRQIRELSGGQRQRVLVAQGLVQSAGVLLLDEPITGLDLTSQQLIVTAIEEERAAGRTVVLTTHDLRDADRADHVVLLAGRVVAQGPPGDVLVADNLRDAYGRHLIAIGLGLALDDAHDHHDPAALLPAEEPGGILGP